MSTFNAPDMDYAALSPIIALTVGLCVVLLAGVFDAVKRAVPALTMAVLAATAGLLIWQWGDSTALVSGALRLDDLAISISLIAILTAAFTVLLSDREPAVAARVSRVRPGAVRRSGLETAESRTTQIPTVRAMIGAMPA